MKCPNLTIVVPCFNEEEVLAQTFQTLRRGLIELMNENLIGKGSKLLFVDDGSRDQTWSIITAASKLDPLITGLKLSRNFGHQKALLAGLSKAVGVSDCLITVDADLQDDIGAVKKFILKYHEGYEVVYGVRNRRITDTLFKRMTAKGFYRLVNRMGMNFVYNHADYRLMSQRAVYELISFPETNLFLRGVVPLIGFRSAKVYYDREARKAGVSKYPFRKMISFAMDGITSFSIVPIRIITFIGFLSAFISILAAGYALYEKLTHHPQLGWTSLILSIWFIGGLLLMSIGLIGEYIGKIYEEVKKRPRFIVEEDLFSDKMKQTLFYRERS